MSWKDTILANTDRMAKMHAAREQGMGFAALEEEFNLPVHRHGSNAKELLKRWTDVHPQDAIPKQDAQAPTGISIMPEPPKKIVIPEGENPKPFVAFLRAKTLGMKPEFLSGGEIEDLWQDALRRDLVDGYTYPKMSEPEKQWLDTLKEAKNENIRLCNKVKAIQRSSRSYISNRNGMMRSTGMTDILSEKEVKLLIKGKKEKRTHAAAE